MCAGTPQSAINTRVTHAWLSTRRIGNREPERRLSSASTKVEAIGAVETGANSKRTTYLARPLRQRGGLCYCPFAKKTSARQERRANSCLLSLAMVETHSYLSLGGGIKMLEWLRATGP